MWVFLSLLVKVRWRVEVGTDFLEIGRRLFLNIFLIDFFIWKLSWIIKAVLRTQMKTIHFWVLILSNVGFRSHVEIRTFSKRIARAHGAIFFDVASTRIGTCFILKLKFTDWRAQIGAIPVVVIFLIGDIWRYLEAFRAPELISIGFCIERSFRLKKAMSNRGRIVVHRWIRDIFGSVHKIFMIKYITLKDFRFK